MSVHAPGRVVRGGVSRARNGLGRAIARALPSSAPLSGGRRSVSAGLSMSSMIDVLVVLTVFLLLTFSASDRCTEREVSMPDAVNVSEIIDAPLVMVGSDAILVDGNVATSQGEMAEINAHGRVARLDNLFNVLKTKHEVARLLAPGREPNSHVILAIGSDVPASVVKSIVLTAARSGYPSIDFMVQPGPKG
ncbi:MAG: Adventurous gliding motility protein [Labilithrix sp.]|nr:Adventurous gliding motility protein [Labilithrix sp.]